MTVIDEALKRDLDRLADSVMILTKRRATMSMKADLAAELTKAFAAQHKAFVDALVQASILAEAQDRTDQSTSGWEQAFAAAALVTASMFAVPIQRAWERSSTAGAEMAAPAMGVPAGAARDAAFAAANGRGQAAQSGIDAMTRSEIAKIIVTGAAGAMLAKRIASLYADYRARRAELIAETEVNAGWEMGRNQAARLSTKAAQKRWVGAGNPCSVCIEGISDDWIPESQGFSNGFDAPPAHPRCRCSIDYADA